MSARENDGPSSGAAGLLLNASRSLFPLSAGSFSLLLSSLVHNQVRYAFLLCGALIVTQVSFVMCWHVLSAIFREKNESWGPLGSNQLRVNLAQTTARCCVAFGAPMGEARR